VESAVPTGITPRRPIRLALVLAALLLAALPPAVATAHGTTAAAKKAHAKAVKKKTRKPRHHAAADAQHNLEQVRQQIQSAEKRIRLTREQREQREAELRQAETEIGALKTNIAAVQKGVAESEARLQQLRAEREQREADRARLLNLVKADLQMAQRQGGQDYFKLLLNQQDPQSIARLMRYYGYLQKARTGRVQSLDETVARLDAIAKEEEQGMQRLQVQRGELQQKQVHLAAAQKQRADAIRVLSAQLESDDERLQRLRRNQQALQSVVDRLAQEAAARAARRPREAEAPAAASAPAQPDYHLVPYHGRCALPVPGGVRVGYGAPRAGGLRWNGLVIAAPAGTPVRAVLPGRVAFADYLRGYGFLIIVDHGRGLMSLYGQNQSLLKKAGDMVGGNEVIASVGDSGGNDVDGLYFEVRVHGKPVDPAGWCAYQ
jgi:septal ring factor EnvC (AmiA/AmiB activator)